MRCFKFPFLDPLLFLILTFSKMFYGDFGFLFEYGPPDLVFGSGTGISFRGDIAKISGFVYFVFSCILSILAICSSFRFVSLRA